MDRYIISVSVQYTNLQKTHNKHPLSPFAFKGCIVFMAAQYSSPTLFGVYEYPMWALCVGWVVVLLPLLFIPGMFLYRLLADGGLEVKIWFYITYQRRHKINFIIKELQVNNILIF